MAAPLTDPRRNWIPSAATRAKMDALLTRYRDPPTRGAADARYKRPTKTQYPIGRGVRMLKDYIVPKYGIRTVYMPGRSRVMTDGQMLDQHQWGHAIDFMTSDTAKINAIAEELVSMGDDIGLQLIIAAGNVLSTGQRGANRFRRYSGASGHYDHLHVELAPEGAAGETRWFQARVHRPTDAELLADASGAEAPFADEGGGAWSALTYAGIAVAALAALGGVALLTR